MISLIYIIEISSENLRIIGPCCLFLAYNLSIITNELI